MWADATGAQEVFVRLSGPVPGCVVVYPSEGSADGYGHCGIVAKASAARRLFAALLGLSPFTVVDCCASLDGIYEHVQRAFLTERRTVFCCLRDEQRQKRRSAAQRMSL
jgi:hypothetical protein